MLTRHAFFGGTFDPVHRGHLAAARAVRDALDLTDFRFLPAGDPPHRDGTFASVEHRLCMLQLALGDREAFTIDERELRRDGPSWMSVTLEEIRREYPHDALLLVLGQDAANGLASWHEWRRLFELAHLVVMTRPGEAPRYGAELGAELAARRVRKPVALARRPAGQVLELDVAPVPVSSTAIRACVHDGVALRSLVPGPVAAYIEAHGLYGDR